jgi:hypothetical protein
MATCGRPTEDGTPCKNPVKRQGLACHIPSHRGFGAPTSGARTTTRTAAFSVPRMPAVPPHADSRAERPNPPTAVHTRRPLVPPPPSRRKRERERVSATARFCADSLSSSWQEAVADRAAEYAQSTWERLVRSRHKRNCKALARIARMILEAKTQVHLAVGKASSWIAGAFGADEAARNFAEELASNIPLPIDAKMIAVARGVQVAGILICVMDGRDLTGCECFVDLALAETKERVKQILVAAMSDWADLSQFRPQAARAV